MVGFTAADKTEIEILESLAKNSATKFYQYPGKDVNVVSAAAPEGDANTGRAVQFLVGVSETVTVSAAGRPWF